MADDSVDVLLPLTEQKGRHFEEKFGKEQTTTFWYQDEKRVVCRLHHLYVIHSTTHAVGYSLTLWNGKL